MTIETIRKKVDALEERESPEVNTWLDFMIAVGDGREIVLGKSMAGIAMTTRSSSAAWNP